MSTALSYISSGMTALSALSAAWFVWLVELRWRHPDEKYPPLSKFIREAGTIFDEWLRSIGPLAEPRDVRRVPRGLLVDLFMPPDRAEDVICNLLGRYDCWIDKHGPRWARIIFFLQSAGSILTFWSDWMLKRLKLLKLFVRS